MYPTFYLRQYLLEQGSIKLEKKEYSVLESDPVTNICAVLTKSNSDCEVGFEFEVLLVINATTHGMRNISAVICYCTVFLKITCMWLEQLRMT